MDRNEFITITVVILMASFTMGWFTNWLATRFVRIKGDNMGEIDQLAKMLHDAEEQRDQAIVYLEQREQELMSQISQAEAELNATMEGLQAARKENQMLRDYVEQHRSRS